MVLTTPLNTQAVADMKCLRVAELKQLASILHLKRTSSLLKAELFERVVAGINALEGDAVGKILDDLYSLIAARVRHTTSPYVADYLARHPTATTPNSRPTSRYTTVRVPAYHQYQHHTTRPVSRAVPTISSGEEIPHYIHKLHRHSADPFISTSEQPRLTMKVLNIQKRYRFRVSEIDMELLRSKKLFAIMHCYKNSGAAEPLSPICHSWPSGVRILVNGNPVYIQKKDEKGMTPAQPAVINRYLRTGENVVATQCTGHLPHLLFLHFGGRETIDGLVSSVKARSKPQSHFLANVVSKFSSDADIQALESRVSLLDPLSLMRIAVPVRSTECNHLEVFDLRTYIQMNQRVPKWLCPICSRRCFYSTLEQDTYFVSILESVTDDEINFFPDGTYKVQSSTPAIEVATKKKPPVVSISLLSQDDDEEGDFIKPEPIGPLSPGPITPDPPVASVAAEGPGDLLALHPVAPSWPSANAYDMIEISSDDGDNRPLAPPARGPHVGGGPPNVPRFETRDHHREFRDRTVFAFSEDEEDVSL
eukprot:TRINITY_DN4107_c0_g1_i1.p1 TRINITY_DN4107_c0_g1~~TRINITY_DN4107_c0_g1_i1.p1  ORF type:complete len:536 (+),score=29.71 TRINITY_DN4107_c0_g1_i1:190-1797(+)